MSDINAPDAPTSSSSCASIIVTIAIVVVLAILLFMLLSPKSPVCLLSQDSMVILDKDAKRDAFDEHTKSGQTCVLFQAPDCPFCQMTLGKRPDRSGQTKDVWAQTRKECASMDECKDVQFVQVDSIMRGSAAPWHKDFVEGFPTLACFHNGTLVKKMSGYNPKGYAGFVREAFM